MHDHDARDAPVLAAQLGLPLARQPGGGRLPRAAGDALPVGRHGRRGERRRRAAGAADLRRAAEGVTPVLALEAVADAAEAVAADKDKLASYLRVANHSAWLTRCPP